MNNLLKKNSFKGLKTINEELGTSQSRNFKNNFSDVASYIDKKDNSYDSGYDFVEELKKYGLETIKIGDEEQSYQKKNQSDFSQLSPLTMTRLARSTGVEENFLDFSNLMKMRQEQVRTGGSEKGFSNSQKLQILQLSVLELNKKVKAEKKQTEVLLTEYRKYQGELEQKFIINLNMLLKGVKQQAEGRIQRQRMKWQGENNQMRQKLYEANFSIKQLQQKIKKTQRLLDSAEQQRDQLKKESEEYKVKQLEVKKSTGKFEIPKTDIDYSFCQIEIEHLKMALSDLQRENSCLKLALETRGSENFHSNEVSQNQNTEMDKSRYLSMIQKFQEQIEILESEIQQLRTQQKKKTQKIMNWERDFQQQQYELQAAIEQCEKKERYLRDFERKLKMKEQALIMREQLLQSSEIIYQRGNISPQKNHDYELPRTPRMRPQMSPTLNSNIGYYSPKLKPAQWRDFTERTPYNKNSSRKFYYGGGQKNFEKDYRINSRIQKIQNSLNRQLNHLSRRY